MNRKAKQERDWEEKPYNKADRARFVEFEAELEFVLTQKFGLFRKSFGTEIMLKKPKL